MRGKRVLIAGVAVLASIAVAALAWHRRAAAPSPSAPAARPPAPPADVTLSGKIRAQHVVNVGATVGGNIDAFLVEVGQEVAEGQALARISNQGVETGQEIARIALDN